MNTAKVLSFVCLMYRVVALANLVKVQKVFQRRVYLHLQSPFKERLVVVSLKTVAVLYEVFGISTVKHDGTTK